MATGVGAPALDVVIESINDYIPDTVEKGNTKNGSTQDDVKIHLNVGSSTRFRFSLYESGTENLYAPGEDYHYDFVVYDIDGSVGSKGGADQISFYNALTYTRSSASTVTVTNDGDSISFTGTGGEVSGQEGLSSFTADQENASIQIQFNNTSRFEFAYSIPNNGDLTASGRNMLWDAQDLNVTGTPENFTPVPEPSSYALYLALISCVFVLSRRK